LLNRIPDTLKSIHLKASLEVILTTVLKMILIRPLIAFHPSPSKSTAIPNTWTTRTPLQLAAQILFPQIPP
jgi:hypothetical protein